MNSMMSCTVIMLVYHVMTCATKAEMLCIYCANVNDITGCVMLSYIISM